MESIQCRFGDMAHLVTSGLEKYLSHPSISTSTTKPAAHHVCRLFPCASLACTRARR